MSAADRAYDAWEDARCDGDLDRADRWALVVLREIVAGRPPKWGLESAPHFAEKVVNSEARHHERGTERDEPWSMAEIMAEVTSELTARMAVPTTGPLWTLTHWRRWLYAVVENDETGAIAAGVALLRAHLHGDRMPWSDGARTVFGVWRMKHAATIRAWRDEVLAPANGAGEAGEGARTE